MHPFESTRPRVALGVVAFTLAAITVGALVVAPAEWGFDSREAQRLAALSVTSTPSKPKPE